MSIKKLVNPRSIAVVGASQKKGRGNRVLENLRTFGFRGDVFAVHPDYTEVAGFPCYRDVASLPTPADCMVVAISAEPACAVLEQGFERGIESAVVLAAGFGEGGHGGSRVARLLRLGARGMSICGPNCYGALNVRTGASAFSGAVPGELRPGNVAIVSQSGGLGANAFNPLMQERRLGFSHFISCGNQVVTHVEDYIAHFVEYDGIDVIAAVVESVKNPAAFFKACARAHALGKTIVVFHAGQSDVGQRMTQSHTGAIATNRDIAAAFWRRCGVIAPRNYDEFVETITLLSVVPQDRIPDPQIIVVSGSGGGAAIVADSVAETSLSFATLHEDTAVALKTVLPEFGSVTNPIDGTGAMSDNPALLPAVFDVLLKSPGNAMIATAVAAWPAGKANSRRFARVLADAAANSRRTIAAYQPSPLGGPLDAEVLDTLRAAGVPVLLGIPSAMRALQHIPRRAERFVEDRRMTPPAGAGDHAFPADYPSRSRFLADRGVAMVEVRLARDADQAVEVFRSFSRPVAIKIESPDILHKTDIGGVRLGCASDDAVRGAYAEIVANVRRAGFQATDVIVQPMHRFVAEAYAAIIHDPVYGSYLTCGLGGIFIEILQDVSMEAAPVSRAQAFDMIARLRAAALLRGARGRPAADIEAFADLLVALGRVADDTVGQFHTLELNPVMLGAAGEGAFAVDIAIV